MCTPSFMQVSFQQQGSRCRRGRAALRFGALPTARAKLPPAGPQPMRNRHRPSSSVERLRLAIDCLPVATREAMLAGVRASERVIAGAYVDGQGGVCPMLAAHRQGSRTDFLSFAKSWDRFTSAARGPRAATHRQVGILVELLEESLANSR